MHSEENRISGVTLIIYGSWDYCSPEVGKDYYGRLCNVGSFCGGTIATIGAM